MNSTTSHASAVGHWASISAYLTRPGLAASSSTSTPAASASALRQLGFADLLEGTSSGGISPAPNTHTPQDSLSTPPPFLSANRSSAPTPPGVPPGGSAPSVLPDAQASYRFNAIQASLLDLNPGQ
jgi:hypothetical protein